MAFASAPSTASDLIIGRTLRDARIVILLCAFTLLMLAGCSSNSSSDILNTTGTNVPQSERRFIDNEQVHVYRPGGKYAAVLKQCIVPEEDPCTLQALPYIGQEHPDPTIANIMGRVMVTHDWMGQRFEQVLIAMPQESLKLFVPVTAVLIGSNVRPSNYWSKYGRIQLDPKGLWLSNSEKLTISQAPDSREQNGKEMKYDSSWRMIKDGDYAWGSSGLTGDNERTLRDILLPMSQLFFHELAHANDAIQKEIFPSLLATDTPVSATSKNEENAVSTGLFDESLGLSVQNSWLYAIARTRTDDDKLPDFTVDFTAVDAGAIMETEGKQTLYGYYTIYEDVATLFAHAMMRRHYGLESQVAYYDKPADEANATCDDYIIGWGSTNRAAADLVKVRSKWVMEQIMGSSAEIDDFYQTVGTEGRLPVGVAYCRSLEIQMASDLRSGESMPSMKELQDYERSLFGPHH
ncbi:MAG: hypothetical protein V3U65_15345 [Granulosicoccaceae bacterium]